MLSLAIILLSWIKSADILPTMLCNEREGYTKSGMNNLQTLVEYKMVGQVNWQNKEKVLKTIGGMKTPDIATLDSTLKVEQYRDGSRSVPMVI